MARAKDAIDPPSEGAEDKDKSRSAADMSPDWQYWRQMPHDALWKAIALSCGIEPRRERLADSSYWIQRARWGDPQPDGRYWEFHDRLEIAKARIAELDESSAGFGDVNEARIKLPEFAAWALSMQWRIPPQLANMAESVTKAAKPAVKSESLGTSERATVQKLIAGFLAQGFSVEQISKPYVVAKEIQGALESSGMSLSDDTIVNWIKEAAPLLATAVKKP